MILYRVFHGNILYFFIISEDGYYIVLTWYIGPLAMEFQFYLKIKRKVQTMYFFSFAFIYKSTFTKKKLYPHC